MVSDVTGFSVSYRWSVSSRVTKKAAFSMVSRACLFFPRLKCVSRALAHGVLEDTGSKFNGQQNKYETVDPNELSVYV